MREFLQWLQHNRGVEVQVRGPGQYIESNILKRYRLKLDPTGNVMVTDGCCFEGAILNAVGFLYGPF